MQTLQHTLDNGIRLVHYRTGGMVAYCGLIINTGSRDEKGSEHGIAHFIEHMLFKGTNKHKAYHILTRLDSLGGELNAYTTKEETVIHASVLTGDFEKAVDTISDIVINSSFPEREIMKEKEVVTDEINSYLDNPAELIFDDFEEMIFPGQILGRNILGTPASVKSFTRNDLFNFMARTYNTRQMVFCSVGNIADWKILRLFTKYFSQASKTKTNKREAGAPFYKPANITANKNTCQNHCIIGNVAYDLRDRRRVGMFLLNNILGGQGLNSRLNMSLREKNGIAYNVESSYNAYYDTGIFSIYFGTDPKNLDKSLSVAFSELNKLRKSLLGSMQLMRAKNQIKGYLARGYENHENLMLSLGKSLLVYGRTESLEEICLKIDRLTSFELIETANEVFEPSGMSTLIYK